MKNKSVLETAFENFCKSQGLEAGEPSHFENGYGSNYITAKPFTVSIANADARLGDRRAVVLHLPSGAISPLTGYETSAKLARELTTPTRDYKADVERYKEVYKTEGKA